ncbi:type II CAAX prenyl endopeptidase Rce1 family protein [Ulvibacterium sp.]|uniref:CPBP family glutamic-type intramembrane protease n=1 Tax=Ulvibacterium sp. TaxID=2665914 RepID=UPI003BA9FB8F
MMKITNSKENMEIVVFSIMVLTLSALLCYISYKLDNPGISLLTVFMPSLVALVLTAIASGSKGVFELFVQQTIRKTALKWLVVSLIGIPIIISLAMLTSLHFNVSKFHLRTTQLLPQVVVIVLIAFGEEYGWRGYLLPRLMKKLSVFHSSLVLGLIWGFWHFPAYLIGTGVPLEMNFLVFLVWVILGALFISWIYYYTSSVLTAILAHISANAAFNYLPILLEFTGSMDAFWWLILYLTISVFAIYYFGRKDLMRA